MSKNRTTTMISISTRKGKAPKVQIDVIEGGELAPHSGYQGKMKADELISLIFELYDIEPSYEHVKPKAYFECVHCGRKYTLLPKNGVCVNCLGDVK